MHQVLDKAAASALRYLSTLRSRSVSAAPEALAELKNFDEPMPQEPADDETVLQMLDEFGSPATIAMAGPRFFGFVIGGSMPVTLAANWLAGAWDQNTAYHSFATATSKLESVSLSWLLDILGLPPDSAGAFVTGATMANFTTLAAARHATLEKTGWDVEADGLFGAPPVNILVSAEAHPTLLKALSMLGFGRDRVIILPVDSQGRIIADKIPAVREPAIICTQAGNINTGAFDPISAICEIAHAAGAWVHVDGAFGLWAAASPSLEHLVRGLSQADSWATDAHKWLNVPYDSGLAFVRHADALRKAMAISAYYLPSDQSQRNPSEYTPELSRRARGVEVWAALRGLGRRGLADMITRTCRHARRFAEGLSAAGYEILNDVVLNQVLVSFGDAETTRAIISDIQSDGTCWCGGTQWQGHTAMRISVSCWATTEEDVELSLAAMLRVAARYKP